MNEAFAVFILTHGRPDKVITYHTLRKQGYTGKIYIIIDNEDKTAERYHQLYGDQVIVFDKLAISKTFDIADNFEGRGAVVYARNACFQIARDLGIDYFLELDDDYTKFDYRFSSSLRLKKDNFIVKCSLDRIFDFAVDFLKQSGSVAFAFGQGGDLIGNGILESIKLKRKVMNTFFCSTQRPFVFVGRMNEDVNTYTSQGNRGDLFFTFFNIAICQIATQAAVGGMSDIYAGMGTYVKTFYAVMCCPSFIKVHEIGTTHRRIHHRISWNEAVPKILDERYRKGKYGNE